MSNDLPGTSLSEKEIQDGSVLSVYDKLLGDFAWDTGIAISKYLAGFKDGMIIGSHCNQCRRTVVPPRNICEWCYRPMDDFIPVSDSGVINTYSLCYVTWDVQRIKDPEIPAVIDFDDASPLHGIMHKLGEVQPDQVTIGMRVQAVWKSVEDREGAITDILYFKPSQENEA
jgi:uncharacterized OB-fold protein